MHLHVVLGILGQLIAIPCALLLIPTSLTEPRASDAGASNAAEKTEDVVVPSLAAAALVSLANNRRVGFDLSNPFQAGVEHLKDNLEEAVAVIKDAVKGITHDLQISAEMTMSRPGWAEVARRDGVTVWKKYFPKDTYGYQYPCVKAKGVVEAPADEVLRMIVDSSRVSEYNRYSKGRTDIELLGPDTKIVWNKAQPPLTSKLHDFCTLMHVQRLDDGGFMLITRATEHPGAPLLKNHIRSEILLGVTVLRPSEEDSTRTDMTTVNHIVSNGVPVMIADRVSTKNAIDFIQNVGEAATAKQ